MTFRKLDERVVHDGGFIKVAVSSFEAGDGSTFTRELVRHPGAVGVVAIDGDDVVLVRQYRASLERELLEIPAGKLDVEGESTADAAVRELEEEVGLRPAGPVEPLARYAVAPGMSDEWFDVFLVRTVTRCEALPQGAEEEAMTIERVPFDRAVAMATSGEIEDAKTIIGLLLARERLSSS